MAETSRPALSVMALISDRDTKRARDREAMEKLEQAMHSN